MAPALTQDSQQELLLPYLSTPPYTPSPPSSLVPTAAVSLLQQHLTNPAISYSNMEHTPYGGQQHQHNNNSSDHHNTTNTSTLTDTHDNPLKIDHDRYNKIGFESSASVEPPRPITLNQPTPPHSTDSSAPLSPLPADKVISKHSTSNTQDCSPAAHYFSAEEFPPNDNKLPTCANENLFSDLIASSPVHQGNSSSQLIDGGLSHTQLLEISLPSPHSPEKEFLSLDSLSVVSGESVIAVSGGVFRSSGVSTSTSVTTSTTFATATLQNNNSITSNEDVRAFSVVAPTHHREDLSAAATTTTSTTSSIRSAATELPPVLVFSGTRTDTEMGCTLAQVENKMARRNSAPQPNDTPPPFISIQPKLTSANSNPSTDPLYDTFLQNIPEEVFRTLNRFVSTNPELLDQLNTSNGNMGTGLLPPTQASSSGGVTSTISASIASSFVSQQLSQTNTVHTAHLTQEQQVSAMVSTMSVQQLKLQKRHAHLLRRIRRISARGMTSSVSTQVEALSNYSYNLLHKDNPTTASRNTNAATIGSPSSDAVTVGSGLQQPPRYDTNALKSMSTANMITYVRRMETRSSSGAVNNTSLNSTNCVNNSSGCKTQSDKLTSHNNRVSGIKVRSLSSIVGVESCLPEHVRSELAAVSGKVTAAVRLHVNHDSDATESSSGGESCDELDGYDDDLHTTSKPIMERALYRYSKERAFAASRWTWLDAQIANIEFKLHQHSRSHLRLRHLGRSSSKAELQIQQQLSCSPNNNGNNTTTLPSPAHMGRPSYTCLTRNSNNINGFQNGYHTHHHHHHSNNQYNNSAASSSNTGTAASAATQNNSTTDSASAPPLSYSPSSSSEGGGSARTSGLRWHRKRRWIRVGNVYETGIKDKPMRASTSINKNTSNSARIDDTLTVRQPTFAGSCECVWPCSCILCTKLFEVGRVKSSHDERYSAAATSYSNQTQQQSLLNKCGSHPPHPPSNPASIPQSPHQFSAQHCQNRTVHNTPPPSPLKSSWPLNQQWSRQQSSTSPPVSVNSARGNRNKLGLCKSAYFPRVASSSRATLNTDPKHVPLQERIAQYDPSYHPVLSHTSEMRESTRLEYLLKSKSWKSKVPSLVGLSSSIGTAEASSHKTSHYSIYKKKKKAKDKSKDRDGKRKDKKKKAYKRREKEAKKGRLTLQGSSDHSHSSSHYHRSSKSRDRGDDSSSVYSSSRASSPSIPPASPASFSDTKPAYTINNKLIKSDTKIIIDNNNKQNKTFEKRSFYGGCGGNITTNIHPNSPAVLPQNKNYTTHHSTDKNKSSSHASGLKTSQAVDRTVAHDTTAAAVSPAYGTRRASMHAAMAVASSSTSSSTAAANAAASASMVTASVAVSSCSTQPLTPATTAAASAPYKNKQVTASYDIDNIVIPYNMASVTRVEHIEYKEIVTPKWREVEELRALDANDVARELDEEDITPQAVWGRHERGEDHEIKKFRSAENFSRHGGNTRTRQRSSISGTMHTSNTGTSSAGTNTPDNPLSPHIEGTDISRPATPMPLSEDSNQSNSSNNMKHSSNLHSVVSLDGTDTILSTTNIVDDSGHSLKPTSEATSTDTSIITSQNINSVVAAAAKASQSEIALSNLLPDELQGNSPAEATASVTLSGLQLESNGDVSNMATDSHTNTDSGDVVASSGTSVSAATSIGRSTSVNSATAARKLRSAGLRTRSCSSSGTALNTNFDENTPVPGRISPFSERCFPLDDGLLSAMLVENTLNTANTVAPVVNTGNYTDYDDIGESTDADDENDHHDDDATSLDGSSHRSKRKLSGTGAVVAADSKKKSKRHEISAALISNHNTRSSSDHSSNKNIELKIDNNHSWSDHSELLLARKQAALAVSAKDSLNKSLGAEGSEGRCSPLSEMTDSAAEDDTTGETMTADSSGLNNSSRPANWSITATADTAGHCILQVSRH